MPKTKLTLTMTWNELDVDKVHLMADGKKCYLDVSGSKMNEFDLANELSAGNLPYPWDTILSQLPKADEFDICARPVDGLEKTRWLLEREDSPELSYEAWLEYTYSAWVQSVTLIMPGAMGMPKRHPEHLSFAARSLMLLMQSPDIHDVLYSEHPVSHWDWKKKLLFRLQPSAINRE